MRQRSGVNMYKKCEKCGVFFKTDNSNRKVCYYCRSELEIITILPVYPAQYAPKKVK
jgi:uncharacterized OB-fold protein